jgi:hypothetical protein
LANALPVASLECNTAESNSCFDTLGEAADDDDEDSTNALFEKAACSEIKMS